MKTRNIFLLALTAIFAASCHTWDEPSVKDGLESFGNKYLQESNVVTVKELKDAFKTEITGGTLKQVTKATQIKVIVTGNDEGSNIYKTLYVADKTGGISISINKGGLFSEAPVGQCMLIELEGPATDWNTVHQERDPSRRYNKGNSTGRPHGPLHLAGAP